MIKPKFHILKRCNHFLPSPPVLRGRGVGGDFLGIGRSVADRFAHVLKNCLNVGRKVRDVAVDVVGCFGFCDVVTVVIVSTVSSRSFLLGRGYHAGFLSQRQCRNRLLPVELAIRRCLTISHCGPLNVERHSGTEARGFSDPASRAIRGSSQWHVRRSGERHPAGRETGGGDCMLR